QRISPDRASSPDRAWGPPTDSGPNPAGARQAKSRAPTVDPQLATDLAVAASASPGAKRELPANGVLADCALAASRAAPTPGNGQVARPAPPRNRGAVV